MAGRQSLPENGKYEIGWSISRPDRYHIHTDYLYMVQAFSDLVKVQVTPTKGKGIFAKSQIARGTRIV